MIEISSKEKKIKKLIKEVDRRKNVAINLHQDEDYQALH